jgi:STE24 endopeptidase
MNEDRGTRYQRLKRRGLVIAATWTTCLLGVLLATGGTRSLRDLCERGVASLRVPAAAVPVVAAAFFAFLLIFFNDVVLLPLAFRRGFALDRRYGLTAESPRAWLVDHLKARALAGAVTIAAAVVVLTFLTAWPAAWWVPAWGTFVVLSVAAAWAMPVWLLPRFYRFAPLERESLVRRLAGLAAQAGVPAVGVYTWFLSDHTRRVNAMMTGLGANRRILVSDTLLADYSDEEVEVILAHELAHHVRHDVWKGLATSAVVAGLALWLGHLALTRLAAPLGLRSVADPAGLPLLVLVAGATSLVLAPLTNALSRLYERQADRFALEATANPAAFTSAIKRLSARNLADEDPPPFARLWFYTHPPVSERLAFAGRWRAPISP